MRRDLTPGEFGQMLAGFARHAFRLELQHQYLEPAEADAFAAHLAGTPMDPLEIPGMTDWLTQLRTLTGEGRLMQRVRVQEEPPTPYQAWERELGHLNVDAGEIIGYMTRAKAYEVDLLPAAGTQDWWLLDDTALIVMTFDNDGHRIATELVDDATAVDQARAWRDLAIRHSVPDGPERTP